MAQPTRGRNSQAKNHLITIVLALIIACLATWFGYGRDHVTADPATQHAPSPEPNGRIGWAGIFCLFAASGLHYCPSLRARTHPKGSPFHSEVHLCAGVNGTSPL